MLWFWVSEYIKLGNVDTNSPLTEKTHLPFLNEKLIFPESKYILFPTELPGYKLQVIPL